MYVHGSQDVFILFSVNQSVEKIGVLRLSHSKKLDLYFNATFTFR